MPPRRPNSRATRGQPLMADPTADNATASTGKSPVMVETGLEGTLGPAATIMSR